MKLNKLALVMCLADPSGNPRPRRAIEICNSLNITVDIVSCPITRPLKFDQHYAIMRRPKTFFKRVFRFYCRLVVWFFPCVKLKNLANNFYYGMHHLDKKLLNNNYDLLIVEDLQQLPLAFKIKGSAKVILDAREYYPLQNEESLIFRWFEKPERIRLCKTYLDKCDAVFTVSKGLARKYLREFDIKTHLMRSTPNYYECATSHVMPERVRMVHHGAANRNRHLEKMIKVFSFLDNRFSLDFYLVGDSAYINKLKELAKPFKGISFKQAVLFDKILPTLNQYDVGFYYVDSKTFNVKNCLPNKFFEFIQARLMVAIGPSPDMSELVNEWSCGVVSESFNVNEMAKKLNSLSVSDIMNYKRGSALASKELCFEQESKQLSRIISSLINSRCSY